MQHYEKRWILGSRWPLLDNTPLGALSKREWQLYQKICQISRIPWNCSHNIEIEIFDSPKYWCWSKHKKSLWRPACWLQPALAKQEKTVAQGSSVSYNMVFSRNNWHETLLGGFVSHQLWLKPRPIVRREAKVHNSEQLLSWEVFDSKQCGHVQHPPKPSLLISFKSFRNFEKKKWKKSSFNFVVSSNNILTSAQQFVV